MDKDLCEQVLIIGPEYRNPKGGIGAVIASHSLHILPFNFISTYKSDNKLFIPLYTFQQYLKIFYFLLKNKNIKIVHIHGASSFSFYRKYLVFLMSKYMFSKKIVYHMHGGGFHLFYEKSPWLIRKVIHHFLEHSDALICLSIKWKNYFEQHFKIKKLAVVPNFFDLTENAFKKEFYPKTVFLFLGKVDVEKGIFDLLSVVNELKNEHKDKFELWIGGNSANKQFEEYLHDNNLFEYVRYLGWISGKEKENALNKADVYVLPSYNEGLPVSIIEAMAHEMPIISTSVGGIPELVKNLESGILIEPGDRIALKNAMEYFLLNRSRISEMGHKSFLRYSKSYTSEIAMKEVFAIYRGILYGELK